MEVKIQWKTGEGNIVVTEVNGSVTVSSDSDCIELRVQNIKFKTEDNKASAILQVTQKPLISCFSTGVWRNDLTWIDKTKWKN